MKTKILFMFLLGCASVTLSAQTEFCANTVLQWDGVAIAADNAYVSSEGDTVIFFEIDVDRSNGENTWAQLRLKKNSDSDNSTCLSLEVYREVLKPWGPELAEVFSIKVPFGMINRAGFNKEVCYEQ